MLASTETGQELASDCPPVRPSACPPVRLSARPPVRLSARPPVRLSACPPVRLSARPPVYLPGQPPCQSSSNQMRRWGTSGLSAVGPVESTTRIRAK
jgi:hypothetical protein